MALTREEIMELVKDMNPSERVRFFITKNVILFGGIDNYVDDFLSKVNVSRKNVQSAGTKAMLKGMLEYPGISTENKDRLKHILNKVKWTKSANRSGTRSRSIRSRNYSRRHSL
jgi:hypothetical protein